MCVFHRPCWQLHVLQDRLAQPPCSFHRIVSLCPNRFVLSMWCSVKTNMYKVVQRADRACAWRKQAGLLSTDLCLELLLSLPSNSTAHLCCPSELSQLAVLKNWHVLWLFCHTGGQMQIDWVCVFFIGFILLLVGKAEENRRPRYPPADLGSVYLIDLWPFYIWKVVLGKKLLFLKWTFGSAENDTLDLAFTKEKIVPDVGRAGRWVFNPPRWCCEKSHVSFLNWRLFYDLC